MSKFVNYHPIISGQLANNAFPGMDVAPGPVAVQNVTALGTVVPKTIGSVWMGTELAELAHSARVELP